MSARDDIFGEIRRALHVKGTEAPRRRVVQDRLLNTPRGVIPTRGQGDIVERVATFREEAERVSATVTEVTAAADVPAEVTRYLRDRNLPARIRFGNDAYLDALPFATTGLEIDRGRAAASDQACLSHAFGGVAETGTLVLASGPDNPTTLNFLPDTHVVVIEAKDIAGDYETVWDKVRHSYGQGLMPRAVNFITGPSRSADIGHSLLLGAHGPRTLHIIVVTE